MRRPLPDRSFAALAPLVAVGVVVAACGTPPAAPSRPDPANCAVGWKPIGSPGADLAELTRRCGAHGGLRPLGEPTIAEQAAGDPPDHYALEVARGGGCFRVFAAGARTITGLDLALRGEAPDEALADLTPETVAMLPREGPVCLEGGRYVVEVAVTGGRGRYALQLWGTAAAAPGPAGPR